MTGKRGKPPIDAPSLFSFDFTSEVQPGDIVHVKCTWERWGHAREYFFRLAQVRSVRPAAIGKGRMYYCTSAPITLTGGAPFWLYERDAEPTGLSWRLPSWEEIREWLDEGGPGGHVISLNRIPRETPHPGEQELVDLLAPLGPWTAKATRWPA